MIWFGRHSGLHLPPPTRGHVPVRERDRLRLALERVASHSPHLAGEPLLEALEGTGWIDRSAAARLLPQFRDFNPDRHFAEHLRRLSFRGASVAEEFRSGIGRVVLDLFGAAEEVDLGDETGFRFRNGEREGILLAYPEVSLTIGGPLRTAIAAAVEQMPDTLVVVARSFQQGAADQFAGLLSGTEVPGTLVTVNLLLGIRATTLRYQPAADRVVDLLGTGRPLRSSDVARLGDKKATVEV
jgi:hypothetical protein